MAEVRKLIYEYVGELSIFGEEMLEDLKERIKLGAEGFLDAIERKSPLDAITYYCMNGSDRMDYAHKVAELYFTKKKITKAEHDSTYEALRKIGIAMDTRMETIMMKGLERLEGGEHIG